VSHKIRGVSHPELVLEIVGHALKHGPVSVCDAQDVLQYVRKKNKAEGYLNLCLQTALLRTPTGDCPTSLSSLVPTPRGRRLYCVAQADRTKATHELLGGMPAYRFHAELLLAELLLSGTIRGTIPSKLITRISQELPWFLEDRLLWVQKAVGWTDSSSYRVIDLPSLRQKLLGLADLETFYDGTSYTLIDEYLYFSGYTDATRADSLCTFLKEQHGRHLYVYPESLSPQALILLLLLIIAQSDGMAVDTRPWTDALRDLLRFGISIRQRDGKAYLSSAVKVVLRNTLEGELVLSGDKGADDTERFLGILSSAAAHRLATEPLREVLALDLRVLREGLMEVSDGQRWFTTSELDDQLTDCPPSTVEIWRTQRLWTDTDISFHENAIQMCQAASPDSAAVLLTVKEINDGLNAGLAPALREIPHLYLLLMLLIDQAQSHASPTLQGDVWCYAGTELLPTLDTLLRSLGYTVWSEGYECDTKARGELADRLVGALIDMRCAVVQFARLELTQDFEHRLKTDFAYLQNQTRLLRSRLRQTMHLPPATS